MKKKCPDQRGLHNRRHPLILLAAQRWTGVTTEADTAQRLFRTSVAS